MGARGRRARLTLTAPAALLLLCAAVLLASGCGGAKRTDTQPPGNPPASPRSEAGIAIDADLRARAAAPDRWAKPLGFAIGRDASESDPAYLAGWVTNGTSITPENALKWEVVAPQRGQRNFAEADALIATAERLGKRIRGHPLVWDQQLPAWVGRRLWTRRELAAVLRERVTELVTRYRGRIAAWDVVNEPFEDDGSWTPNVFYTTLGERYVDIALRAARAADPEARLFINELAAEKTGPKQRALLRLAGRLKRRGVPIDGLGFQNHTVIDDFPTRAQLDATFDAVSDAGLEAELTEMDVPLRTPGRLGPDATRRQARGYRQAAAACAAHRACTGLTIWGVTDRWSWLGSDRYPLPFDASGRPKPAWESLRAAFEP